LFGTKSQKKAGMLMMSFKALGKAQGESWERDKRPKKNNAFKKGRESLKWGKSSKNFKPENDLGTGLRRLRRLSRLNGRKKKLGEPRKRKNKIELHKRKAQ